VDLAGTLPYACSLAERDAPGHRSILAEARN